MGKADLVPFITMHSSSFFLSQLIKMHIELCVKLQCTACFAMTACYCKLTACKLGLLIEKLRGGAKLYVL